MPCFVTGSAEGDRALSLETDVVQLTRYLCEMKKLLTDEQRLKLSSNLRYWITNHNRVDRAKRNVTRRNNR